MVKQCHIYFLLICFLSLCGCAKAREISVIQSENRWEITDIKLNNLPQEANTYVEAVTNEGIYYCCDLADAKSTYIDASWHFLTFSGEDISIYHEPSISYYTSFINDSNLIIAMSFEKGIKVLELSPDGTTKELFQQNASQLPFIAASNGWIASIRNNFQNDGISYNNTLVLTNTSTGTETSIYQATQQIDSMTGEDILSVCLNNGEVSFTVKETLTDKTQHWLYTYNISKEEITDKLLLEKEALYVIRVGNIALMSLDNEMGSIGEIIDNSYQEKSKIPLMSSANMIYASACNTEGIYVSCYESGYFWNTDTNEIYVYDFKQINTEGRSITGKGIQYIIREGNEAFVRTLSVKSLSK